MPLHPTARNDFKPVEFRRSSETSPGNAILSYGISRCQIRVRIFDLVPLAYHSGHAMAVRIFRMPLTNVYQHGALRRYLQNHAGVRQLSNVKRYGIGLGGVGGIPCGRGNLSQRIRQFVGVYDT